MKIQLFADPEHLESFRSFFSSQSSLELVERDADVVVDATFLQDSQVPRDHEGTLILNTLTSAASSAKKKGGADSVVGIPMLPNYISRQSTLEYAVAGSSESQASDFITAIGKKAERIEDAIAGVFPRTLAMIINEAAFAVQEGVATAVDIDMAMKLGTNYPKGPLAWSDEIGAGTTVAILDALASEYGSERYKVATILRRYAESGTTFHNSQ